MWESWEGTLAQGGIASLDHYSKGAVLKWVFRVMCGIQVEGQNHFRIAPRPGGRFTRAHTEYVSIYGRIVSGWERRNGKTMYTVDVPANTTATLVLPNGETHELTAGHAVYEVN